METTSITFRPLSSIGGQEVIGLDLREEQTNDIKLQLKKKCHEHFFLLFRNQDITSMEQLRIGKIFGNVLEEESYKFEGNFVASTGELSLHFDHWLINNYPQPVDFTMLYGMDVVPLGGETVLANVQMAYQYLPNALKAQIQNMQAIHSYDYSPYSSQIQEQGSKIGEAIILPDQPYAIHNIVRAHPSTEEKILYVSPRNTTQILNLSSQESKILLQRLSAHIEHPENIYAHKWEIGDLLIWDNHAMLHGRKDFNVQYKRKLRRLSVLQETRI